MYNRYDEITEERQEMEKGKEKQSMEVERKILTSCAATKSGLLTLILHYCTATEPQRNDNPHTNTPKPLSTLFTYTGRNRGFLCLFNEIGEGRGRIACH